MSQAILLVKKGEVEEEIVIKADSPIKCLHVYKDYYSDYPVVKVVHLSEDFYLQYQPNGNR